MKKVAEMKFSDGTRYELWKGAELSKTVFVDERGWNTDNWWSDFGLAQADFDGTKTLAARGGTLVGVENVA